MTLRTTCASSRRCVAAGWVLMGEAVRHSALLGSDAARRHSKARPLRSAAHLMVHALVHALLCSSGALLRLVGVLLRLAERTCCILCSVPAAVPLRRRPAGLGCRGLLLCARLCKGLPGVS